jgi:hypothetical protein
VAVYGRLDLLGAQFRELLGEAGGDAGRFVLFGFVAGVLDDGLTTRTSDAVTGVLARIYPESLVLFMPLAGAVLSDPRGKRYIHHCRRYPPTETNIAASPGMLLVRACECSAWPVKDRPETGAEEPAGSRSAVRLHSVAHPYQPTGVRMTSRTLKFTRAVSGVALVAVAAGIGSAAQAAAAGGPNQWPMFGQNINNTAGTNHPGAEVGVHRRR